MPVLYVHCSLYVSPAAYTYLTSPPLEDRSWTRYASPVSKYAISKQPPQQFETDRLTETDLRQPLPLLMQAIMRRYQLRVRQGCGLAREYKRTMKRGLVPYAEQWLADEREVRILFICIYIYTYSFCGNTKLKRGSKDVRVNHTCIYHMKHESLGVYL